ncbi:MAG: transglycosylase domain-containing protein [Sulfobacillus sp.]|nr:transglycosylase domain-containing protein [Sulfobacillus sp.]
MRCPRCGQDNVAGSQFCRHCGKKLPAPAKASPPATTSATKNTPPKSRRIRWGRVAALAAGVVILAGAGFSGYEFVKAARSLPQITNLVALNAAGQDSVVYDRFGQPVATLHLNTNRIDVPLNAISPNMQHAIVAIEDHNFYRNDGFDIRSIFRAAFVDLTHRSALQGASTITEQLAKTLYLHDNHTLTYKIQEFLLGLELARHYSKPQILDMYLNEVYLGDGAYGVDAAAKAYFNETPSQLTLPQAALLAGLPQAPSLYDPLTNYQLAKQRQWQVLQAMVKWGYITPQEATQAYHASLGLSPQTVAANTTIFPYPWYIQHVIHLLEGQGFTPQEIYDGGLKIYTELDPTVYNIAQNAVDYWMNYNFGVSPHTYPYHQAAVVVEDPHTGAVLAEIGGRNYVPFGEDYATGAKRSTGSSIKPLIDYTPALVKGYTQMSVIQDVPIFQNVDGQAWWPKNDDHIYRGYMTLRDALAISDNDVAVHLLHDIGLNYGFNFAVQKFGLPLPPSDLQLGAAIGGLNTGVNVYEMTQAFATFPNQGVRMAPLWVTKVVAPTGAVLYQDTPHGTPEFSAQIAYIMTNMMQRVLNPTPLPGIGPGAYPTGMSLGIGRPAAGKTGTNNGQADAWFIGYEPQLVVGVWEGNRLGEFPQYTIHGQAAFGDVAAGPIWQTIMEQVNQAENIPAENFPRPSGLVYVPNISITSGKIAGPNCPPNDIEGAWFIQGTQPTTIGHTHIKVKVVAANPKLLWQPGCGPAIQSVFLKPESDWHSGVPLPWDHIFWPPTESCTPGQSPSPSPSGTPSSTSATSSSQSATGPGAVPPSATLAPPPPSGTPSPGTTTKNSG